MERSGVGQPHKILKWHNLYIILCISLLIQCKNNTDNEAKDVLLDQV